VILKPSLSRISEEDWPSRAANVKFVSNRFDGTPHIDHIHDETRGCAAYAVCAEHGHLVTRESTTVLQRYCVLGRNGP
jgi:hypothetical protein